MDDIEERRDIARLLYTLIAQLGAGHERCAEELGIPLAQASALYKLDATLPMHELAERLGCHTSNATGITDRLAARGLVERTDDPADRRVKRVGLTPQGQEMRERLIACGNENPSPLDRLTPAQRGDLRRLLEVAAGPIDVAEATRRAARILGVTAEP